MKIIALTGNIASGKSTVAQLLTAQGFAVVDADAISHSLSQPNGLAHAALLQAFNTADRRTLRQIVFNNPAQKQKLEAILHPLIAQESKKIFKQLAAQKNKVIFYEAALIFEAQREKEFDGILLVQTNPAQQIARLTQRNPDLDLALAQQIVQSQMSQSEKAQRSTWVIDNNFDLAELKKNVLTLIKKNQWVAK